jgi:transposase InsO family protein
VGGVWQLATSFNRGWGALGHFESIAHAQDTATKWLWRYNNERLNMALGGITPQQKLIMAA